ncbi:sensor histidine kinase [Streptomyces sp. RPT161]|uniref:sensor histidine kinase n=1 Tax=Streptomyces sp. RPT161 TaxID=3015993 RepID=UPI0022B85C90|nr:histidine kinase [Streptomyces sp. RPT161]
MRQMSSPRIIQRWLHWPIMVRGAMAGTLLAILLWEEGGLLSGHPSGAHLAVWIAGVLVSLCLLPWGPLAVRAGVAAGVSWTATVVLLWYGSHVVVWGLTETLVLLVLLVQVLRRVPVRAAVLVGAALAAGAVAAPVRDAQSNNVAAISYAVIVAGAAALGLYLRAWDVELERSQTAARNAERLELAGELHDFVAHNVTAITVLARASEQLAVDNPSIAASLRDIELAGGEAMTSSRRMLRVLRAERPQRQPLADLEKIEDLAHAFRLPSAEPGAVRPAVSLTVDPRFYSGLAPDLATTVHRIVQEALANVAKHSPRATTVRIALRCDGGRLHVSVRNDGHRPRRAAEDTGGLGLVSLSERADAIGGSLIAGPLPDGGWEVLAVLPAE